MNINAFKGCLMLGAIGDSIGSSFENSSKNSFSNIFELNWSFTDDTQLTLATTDSILRNSKVDPGLIADTLSVWYGRGRFRGLGASTYKALRELQLGGHWALVGRKGEYAAGNGSAMRIAPLAFLLNPEKIKDRVIIRDVSRITHHSEEAYCGALAVLLAIQFVLSNDFNRADEFVSYILSYLPDSNTKDKIVSIFEYESSDIVEIGERFGNSGYVADSVPFAIFCASRILFQNVQDIFSQIVYSGGDTDTNCSIAGNIIGTYLGFDGIPDPLLERVRLVREYWMIESVFGML